MATVFNRGCATTRWRRRTSCRSCGSDENDQRGYVMPPERSLDIDTPLDVAFAEFLLERGIKERR
jgi:hypothetical protein